MGRGIRGISLLIMSITELIKQRTGSLSVLQDDIKNLFVIGEKVLFSLIPVQISKTAICPLKSVLNSTSLYNEEQL